MNIAIYGGSFNPPHLAHQEIVQKTIERCDIDQLIIVPVFTHAFDKNLIDFNHRLNMCKLAFGQYHGVFINDIEAYLKQPNYTFNTLIALKKQYPADNFTIIVGEDVYYSMSKWYKYDELMKEVSVLVFDRYDKKDVSSTEIRYLLKNGKDCAGLISNDVFLYIEKHGLYK